MKKTLGFLAVLALSGLVFLHVHLADPTSGFANKSLIVQLEISGTEAGEGCNPRYYLQDCAGGTNSKQSSSYFNGSQVCYTTHSCWTTCCANTCVNK